jgi:hypothetical protein
MEEDPSDPSPPTVDPTLALALAGAVNQHYTKGMERLNKEIRVLREGIDLRRPPPTDDQRRHMTHVTIRRIICE